MPGLNIFVSNGWANVQKTSISNCPTIIPRKIGRSRWYSFMPPYRMTVRLMNQATSIGPHSRWIHLAVGLWVNELWAGATLDEGVSVVESVVQAGVRLGAHVQVEQSVIVRNTSVGAGTKVSAGVLGEGCVVGSGNGLGGGICLYPETVLPDTSIQFCDGLLGRERR